MTSAKKYNYELCFETILQYLQRNVRHLRKTMKLTAEEAARRSGIHRRHWQRIEAGENNATLDTIIRIANGLEVDLDELLGSKLPPVRKVTASKRPKRKKKRARPQAHHPRARR